MFIVWAPFYFALGYYCIIDSALALLDKKMDLLHFSPSPSIRMLSRLHEGESKIFFLIAEDG